MLRDKEVGEEMMKEIERWGLGEMNERGSG